MRIEPVTRVITYEIMVLFRSMILVCFDFDDHPFRLFLYFHFVYYKIPTNNLLTHSIENLHQRQCFEKVLTQTSILVDIALDMRSVYRVNIMGFAVLNYLLVLEDYCTDIIAPIFSQRLIPSSSCHWCHLNLNSLACFFRDTCIQLWH